MEILKRLGRSGFRELAPFITGDKEWSAAVFTTEVLAVVELDEFIFVSSLANEGSRYRNFFMKCYRAGNLTAQYVEGLRRAVKYGPSRESLHLMEVGSEDNVYARFAFGIFLICNGHYEEGTECLRYMCLIVSWLEDMVGIADIVMAQIADIEPPMSGMYKKTYRYADADIPQCVYFGCNMDDVCFNCIGYWYALRVRDMC